MAAPNERNPVPQSRVCQYRVLHQYIPPEEYLGKGYLVIEEGDVIQVNRPVNPESGTEENPEGWLQGKNIRNGQEGYFPSGAYVQFLPEKIVQPAVPPTVKPRAASCPRRHSPSATFFLRPIQCSCCQDYIWGVGAVGTICKDCGQCFHKECESMAVSFASCSKTPPAKKPPVHDQPVPLSRWDTNNVADWMSVVNLHRYAHIFMKCNIKGDVLSKVDESMLRHSMKIEDEFQQKAILACIGKLCSNKTVDPVPMVELEGASKSDHRFIVYSFSSMQPCHLCSEVLWGLLQQGYQCRDCGLCCHRKCSVGNLPKCNSERLKHLKRISFAKDTVFGIPLNEQFSVSDATPAPPVVMRFTSELEKRTKDKASTPKAVDAYRLTGPTGEINRLKILLSETDKIEDVNLESFDMICITGALKKYLRDLPNAVITEELYEKFLKQTQMTDEETMKRNLLKLVDELPVHHRSTLDYLLGHFIRCIKLQFTTDDSIRDATNKLSRVFCQIIIRPPWESIIEIVFNAESSLRVVTMLLQSKLPPPTGTVVQVTRRPSRQAQTSSMMSVVSDMPYTFYGSNIEDAPWYWKDMSKEELNEKMSNTPDGTFLVRDSSDGVKDNYTLALRKGGSNRFLKIYRRDGKFGLMDPLQFNSVVDLINYYLRNSLAHFNKTLDITLMHPICRNIATIEDSEIDMKKEREAYIRADKEYNDEAKRFEKLHDEHAKITEELQMRHQAMEAFKETIAMFKESVKIVEKNERLVPQSELRKARDNFELLKRQLKSVVDKFSMLEQEIRDLTVKSKARFKEMNAMKPDLQSKGELRDQLRQKLLKGGDSPKKLEQLVSGEEDNGNATPEESTSHHDESTWLLRNCDRKHAIDLLAGKAVGTFLIRPRQNEPDYPYGLTIVSCNDVVHCKIGKKETGYGFADPFFIHETLMDLVMHYKDTSLVEHNDELDVMLDFPVLGKIFTKPHNKHSPPSSSKQPAPAVPSRTRRDNYESLEG